MALRELQTYCSLSTLAITGVLLLITFLSFSSQYLLLSLDPGPLSQKEIIVFNVLIIALLISYARAVRVDAGHVPRTWENKIPDPGCQNIQEEDVISTSNRWCRKCERWKPPRAHHCRACERCILKMDHHCPWTANCVGHRTIPHFMRFVFFSVAAMSQLEMLLFSRLGVLWRNRRLPSYRGPSVWQLVHLLALVVVNTVTLFALLLLLLRASWSFANNTTFIEQWEIERHEALVKRARRNDGYLHGPKGVVVRIAKQEYPYDVGIFANLSQAMGTWNILVWLWPFAASPPNETGLSFPVNGFEDSSLHWPPPDPDRIAFNPQDLDALHSTQTPDFSSHVELDAFRQRQQQDLQRRKAYQYNTDSGNSSDASSEGHDSPPRGRATSSWRNSEGEALIDFGVDENADEDIPLAQLIARQKAALSSSTHPHA